MALRPCDYCGNYYEAHRRWQRYCSTAHRVAAHREQQRTILEAATRAGITASNAHTILTAAPPLRKGLETNGQD